MKKKILFIFVFFILLIDIHAKDFSFNIQTETGFSYEKLGEYLFKSETSNQKKSYLEWQNNLMPVIISGTINWKDFFITNNFEYLIPLSHGYMHDSDWYGSIKTNYAIFTNYADSNFSYSFRLGCFFNLHDKLVISPIVEFNYKYDSYSAKNGYGYYGREDGSLHIVEWNSPQATFHSKLSEISYCRKNILSFLGLSAKYSPASFYSLNITFLISPFAISNAMDYHSDELDLDRDYYMHGIFTSFFKNIKTEVSNSFTVSKHIQLQLNFRTCIGFLTRGKTETTFYRNVNFGSSGESTETWTYLGKSAGIDFSSFSLFIGFKAF